MMPLTRPSWSVLPWRRALMIVVLVLFVLAMLTGCTETRTERQADTEKRDTFTVRGDATVPMPQGGTALIPVEFTVERVGSERLVEHSESKTQIDGAAIAQQVGGMVGKTLDAAIAKLTGLQLSNARGVTPTEGGLMGGLGGLALLAGREWLARRREEQATARERQALAEVKQQRDTAHAKNIELAERAPPPGQG